MKSLRTRAIIGGIIWAVLSILIGAYGVASFLEDQTEGRFDDQLISRHTQLVIAVANHYANPEDIAKRISDPFYQQPFSGHYWQVENESGDLFVSESLVDSLLPQAGTPFNGTVIADFIGPGGERLRGIEEWLTLYDGSTWHIQVASSTQELRNDRASLRNNLILAFGLIISAGIAGAMLLVITVLRPLTALRVAVLERWGTDDVLEVEAYPSEVAPLVSDINTLHDRNREIVSRSRRQAADLAHAIKTPSAIVRNELEKLRRDGTEVAESIDALDRLDAQLKRTLARIRADGSDGVARVFTDVDLSLGRMTRAFTALAKNEGKILISEIEPGLRVRMDQSDFEEVTGNLMDNAMKWSNREVRIRGFRDGDQIEIQVDDDGPGIPADDLDTVTLSGRRLDTSKPGTGLGLAIAADLAHAYGGRVSLGPSDALGGLQARIILKVSGV